MNIRHLPRAALRALITRLRASGVAREARELLERAGGWGWNQGSRAGDERAIIEAQLCETLLRGMRQGGLSARDAVQLAREACVREMPMALVEALSHLAQEAARDPTRAASIQGALSGMPPLNILELIDEHGEMLDGAYGANPLMLRRHCLDSARLERLALSCLALGLTSADELGAGFDQCARRGRCDLAFSLREQLLALGRPDPLAGHSWLAGLASPGWLSRCLAAGADPRARAPLAEARAYGGPSEGLGLYEHCAALQSPREFAKSVEALRRAGLNPEPRGWQLLREHLRERQSALGWVRANEAAMESLVASQSLSEALASAPAGALRRL